MSETGAARPSWVVIVVAVVLGSVAPITAAVVGVSSVRNIEAEHAQALALTAAQRSDQTRERCMNAAEQPQNRLRCLRLLVAIAHDEGTRAWAKREVDITTEDAARLEAQMQRRDALQHEAFALAAKALEKNPEALADHYRQLGFAIGEGRVASTGVIESIHHAEVQPKLSDLLHKLMDEKETCIASGKEAGKCEEESRVAAAPSATDYEALRDLESKAHANDREAQRKLVDMRKRFLKEEVVAAAQ